jgi:hypothetical protein
MQTFQNGIYGQKNDVVRSVQSRGRDEAITLWTIGSLIAINFTPNITKQFDVSFFLKTIPVTGRRDPEGCETSRLSAHRWR